VSQLELTVSGRLSQFAYYVGQLAVRRDDKYCTIERVRSNTIQLVPAYVGAYSKDDDDASGLPQMYGVRNCVLAIDIGMTVAHEHRRPMDVAATAI